MLKTMQWPQLVKSGNAEVLCVRYVGTDLRPPFAARDALLYIDTYDQAVGEMRLRLVQLDRLRHLAWKMKANASIRGCRSLMTPHHLFTYAAILLSTSGGRRWPL